MLDSKESITIYSCERMLGNQYQYLEPLKPCIDSLCKELLSLSIVTITSCYKIGEANANGPVLIYCDKDRKGCFKSKKGKILPIMNKSISDSLFVMAFTIPTASVKSEKLVSLIGTACMSEDTVSFNAYFFVEACKTQLFCEAVMNKVNKNSGGFCNKLLNRSQSTGVNFPMSSIALYGSFVMSNVVGGLWDNIFDEKVLLKCFSGLHVEFVVKEEKKKRCCYVRSKRKSSFSLVEYQMGDGTYSTVQYSTRLSSVFVDNVKNSSRSTGKM